MLHSAIEHVCHNKLLIDKSGAQRHELITALFQLVDDTLRSFLWIPGQKTKGGAAIALVLIGARGGENASRNDQPYQVDVAHAGDVRVLIKAGTQLRCTSDHTAEVESEHRRVLQSGHKINRKRIEGRLEPALDMTPSDQTGQSV